MPWRYKAMKDVIYTKAHTTLMRSDGRIRMRKLNLLKNRFVIIEYINNKQLTC